MRFSLTNTGITILFVEGFTHGRGYSLLNEESIGSVVSYKKVFKVSYIDI